MYKTKDIDYTGCDPVIAEHLKRGEGILCDVWDCEKNRQQEYVTCFDVDNKPACYCTEKSVWHYATPIERTQYVKKASEIMAWLEDNGWGCNGYGDYYKDYCDNSTIGFMATMHQFCGKNYQIPAINFYQNG